MRKFKRNFKKYICLSLCMALIITTVFVGTAATADSIEYYRSAKVWNGGDNGDTISVSDYALLKGDGSAADAEEAEFNASYIKDLMANLQTGDVTAKKTVLFANGDDKAKGYLKTNLDIVGNVTQTGNPKDVLFVSTVSNTAAMFCKEYDNTSFACPCMNAEHYYRIPSGFELTTSDKGIRNTIKNEANMDLYFNINDVCGEKGYWDLNSVTVRMINDYLKNTYGQGLTIEYENGQRDDSDVRTGNTTRNFWRALLNESSYKDRKAYLNHYCETDKTKSADNEVMEDALIWYKSANGEYKPKKTNMIPAASKPFSDWRKVNPDLAFGSPKFDNSDGCFDRMMISKKIIKSFTSDLLENNTGDNGTDNRVALINYAGFVNGSLGTESNNSQLTSGKGNKSTQFPIINFVDFTSKQNDSNYLNAVDSLKAYSGNDYAAAMYAASQVMMGESEIAEGYAEDVYKQKDSTEATLDPETLSKGGYIWQGDEIQRNKLTTGGLYYPIYSFADNKYWSMPNLTKVKGTRDNADKIVVFLTDSMPSQTMEIQDINKVLGEEKAKNNKGGEIIHSMMTYNYKYDDSLTRLKEKGAKIYSAGYMVVDGNYTCYHLFEDDGINNTTNLNTMNCLRFMASGENDEEKAKYFKNAQNTEEFINFLNTIKGDLLKTQCKSASDTLGDNYSFICDEKHPVSVQVGAGGTTVTYTSLDDAVQSGYFSLSDDKKTITWNGGNVSKGVRISFYSKLDDEYLFPKNASAETKEYPTNNAQTVVYTKEDEDVERNGNVAYADYKLMVRSGSAKVVLSRTPAGDIRTGKDITYTLSLVKSGAIDLESVTVSATTPQYTNCKEGSILPQNVTITKDEPLSYTVTANGDGIKENETVIEHFAHFTISKNDNGIQNDIDLNIGNINTNTVKNAISTNGTITITAPDKKLAHDKTQAYIYSVKDSNGKEIAKVMVAAGKQEVISGLKEGAYTVTEIADWAWRYKDGNTNEIEVSISNNNPDGYAEFIKEKQKAGALSGHSSKWSNKYGVNGGVSTNG